MDNQKFGGDKKTGKWLFDEFEKKFIDFMLPRIPQWVHTYHLTLATIPICVGIIYFSLLATVNIKWLLAVAFLIVMQWATDVLDGALGRERKEGFIRWGYYMDHFLDFVFLISVLIGYMVILTEQTRYIQFYILATFAAFMFNSHLEYASTGKFRIAYMRIGPTVIRLMFVVIDVVLAFFGTTHIGATLPWFLAALFFSLCVVVYQTQDEIWKLDMKIKQDGGN